MKRQPSIVLFGNEKDSKLQSPWFEPDREPSPSQRLNMTNLKDFIYGDMEHRMDHVDDDKAFGGYPSGCNAGAHFREVLSSTYMNNRSQASGSDKSKSTPMSVFRMFTSCTSSNIGQFKEVVGQAYKDALSTQCGEDFASATEFDDGLTIPPSMDTFEEDEDNRLRRLGSWNTLGTMGTIGTLATQDHSAMRQFDDDGSPINAKILQVAQENLRNFPGKRTRLVKFDYPPVSSVRQCPRAPREDLPELFFTEEELENYELDRMCTRRTDDIEIVAISQSLSDLNQSVPEEGKEIEIVESPANSSRAGFGSYVPTPRMRRTSSKQHESFTSADNVSSDGHGFSLNKLERRSSWSKAARPTPESPSLAATSAVRRQQSISSASQPSPRLVKSVQIFLRERSTGR